MRRIVFNGKFLGQKMTGVQRVADALVRQISLRNAGAMGAELELALATPAGSGTIDSLSIRHGRLRGNLWEQAELPLLAGRDLLVNLCNMGPACRTGDVLMIHDTQVLISPKSYSLPFRAWYGAMWPLLAARASRLLTVSHYAKSCIVEAGIAPADKVSVIHNGVDHILSVKSTKPDFARLDLEDRPYFLGLANTQAHKNIPLLFKAMRQVKNKEARLVLIGAASRADFEQMDLPAPSNVIFAGRVSDSEMRGLIEHAVAFAFPSLTEGFGLPPLEAMLLGVPSVVAPCGALPELCQESAIYADAQSSEAWAHIFDQLIEDVNFRHAYGTMGQMRAEVFTWSSAANRLANILHQV